MCQHPKKTDEQRQPERLCSLAAMAEKECLEFSDGSDVSAFLVKSKNQAYAYRNSCPHTGAPLNWKPNAFLDIGNRFILCALHGALFEIDTGLCIDGPCRGSRLETISVKVEGGEVFLAAPRTEAD